MQGLVANKCPAGSGGLFGTLAHTDFAVDGSCNIPAKGGALQPAAAGPYILMCMCRYLVQYFIILCNGKSNVQQGGLYKTTAGKGMRNRGRENKTALCRGH